MKPFKGDYPITQPYGVRNCDWYSAFPNCEHPGVDYGCPEGTELLSIDDGEIKQSYFNGGEGYGYGNLIVIQHDGYLVYYGHLSKRYKQAGDRVKAGEVIGLSGSTGLSTGAHLHFEVRVAGNPVDPMPYIDKQYIEDILKDLTMNYNELLRKLEGESFVKKDERFTFYPDGKPAIVNHGKQYIPDLGDLGVVYMKFARPIREVEKNYPITKDRKEVLN